MENEVNEMVRKKSKKRKNSNKLEGIYSQKNAEMS